MGSNQQRREQDNESVRKQEEDEKKHDHDHDHDLPSMALNHVSRLCRSVEDSLEFYTKVLGFVKIERPQAFSFDGAWLFNYGVGIHLVQSKDEDRLPSDKTALDPMDNHISFQQLKPLCHDTEKFALLGFKRSFLLDCTNSKSHSAYPKVESWHDVSDHHFENSTVSGDCCRWDGVKCNEETGHVIGLDLSSSCLYGTYHLNNSLFLLDHLLEINLADNHFKHSLIPSNIGRLNKLTSLNLSESSFRGRIPWEISKLSSLSVLDLSYNDGLYLLSLEKLLRNLTCLSQLHLDHVQIHSAVPVFLSNRSSLKAVTLRSCSLVGKFPTGLLQLPNLEKVVLDSNLGLQGHLPDFQSSSHLKHLSLSNTAFFGGLPTSLGNLGSLNVLNLSSCKFSGSIPPSLGNLTKLTYLALNDNDISGDLRYLIQLTQLATLDLSDNQFYGVIPKQICNANSLFHLDLSNNALSGKIPSCIGGTLGVSLHVLNLENNSFTGIIPDTFPTSCQLEYINLRQNQLEGKLPKSLVNCSMLQLLDVGTNLLNDTFPPWLGSLPKLVLLSLGENYFHGRITTPVIGRFHCLRIFDLSSNFFTGELPADYFQHWLALKLSSDSSSDPSDDIGYRTYMSFCGSSLIHIEDYGHVGVRWKGEFLQFGRILTYLYLIDFSSNELTGRIPESIGSFVDLVSLNLSNNYLVGCIPSSLSNLTKLEVLDLSQNMLSGKIPQELTQLDFLVIFNVSHNHLVGPIPQGNEFSTFDESSYYGNLALCGHPLANPCGAPVLDSCENIDSLPSSPTEEIEEDTKFIDWLIISLGGVSGFTIGFVLGTVYIADRLHQWFIKAFKRRKTNAKARRSTPRHRRN